MCLWDLFVIYIHYFQVTSSILKESGNYVGFANQLSALGLKLRDIPGDGLVF